MTHQPHSDKHESLSRLYDRLELIAYIAIIVIATPTVAQMLSDAWYSYGFSPSVFFFFRDSLGVSHQEFVLFFLGAYAGLLLLLLLDDLKRIQGSLLAIASAIAFVELRSQGLFTPLHPVTNGHALVAGFVVAYVLGEGYKLASSDPPFEFRRATSLLFWTVAIIVSIGFVEKHLIYPNPLDSAVAKGGEEAAAGLTVVGDGLFTDIVVASMFVFGAYMFMSYEAKTNAFVMGVQRAGKTLLAGGLSIAADEEAEHTRLNPSQPLSRLVTSLQTAAEGWGDDEYVGPNNKGEFNLLQFQTQKGTLFKQYIEIDVLDYAGEYVNQKLVMNVKEMAPRSRLSLSWFVYMYESIRGIPNLPEQAKGLNSDRIQHIMAKQIIHSDTLVIIVDSGSLLPKVPYGDEDYEAQQDLSEYLDHYVQILKHLNKSTLAEKEIVLVATKADYLYQLYRNSKTHLSFFNWVNFYLMETEEGQEKLGPLLNQAQVSQIYPVYYELDVDATEREGEPIPERPISVNGSKELLTQLKESA